jgi:hypothetical protein
MKFTEWFDVSNKKHVEAYANLARGGTWPVGFIPPNVEMDSQWQLVLLGRMADRWVKAVLGELQVPK